MTDAEQKKKLQRALARLVASKQQLDTHREQLQKHASDRLDAVQDEARIGSEHLEKNPNVLTYRYTKRALVESAILRGISLRAEHGRAKDADKE